MSEGGVEVRDIGPDDWELWKDLRLRSLADAPDAFGSTLAREQEFDEELWRSRLGGPAVVGYADGVPAALGAGFAVRPGWLQVVAMWTAPAYRGRGLSRLVLERVVAHAADHGQRVVLDVTQGNAVARRAYERFGFVATGASEPLREGSTVVCDEMVLPESATRRRRGC